MIFLENLGNSSNTSDLHELLLELKIMNDAVMSGSRGPTAELHFEGGDDIISYTVTAVLKRVTRIPRVRMDLHGLSVPIYLALRRVIF